MATDVRGFERLAARFWSLVERPSDPDDCWTWKGRITSKGYAALNTWGGFALAHIFSWEIVNGPVPDGLVIDHTCRNRACVNPGHLEPVTSKINTLRGNGITAQQARQTTCKYGHPFDGRDRRGLRRCSICANRRNREYAARKRRQRAGAAA